MAKLVQDFQMKIEVIENTSLALKTAYLMHEGKITFYRHIDARLEINVMRQVAFVISSYCATCQLTDVKYYQT